MKSSIKKTQSNSRFCALVCLQACILGAAWAQATTSGGFPIYKVTEICTPLGNSVGFPGAVDINDKGQVVGVAHAADGSMHPFLWWNGRTTELPAGFTPVRINNSGQVLANTQSRAFVWQNGKSTDLGSLGSGATAGSDINDKGQVIGLSSFHPFLWQNGTITDISGLFAEPLVLVSGINKQGDIAAAIYIDQGTRENGVLLKDGKTTNLGYAPGGWNTGPTRVNAKDQVIGSSGGPSDAFSRAFLWQDGKMTDLGTLAPESEKNKCVSGFQECSSFAEAINIAGQVVGSSDIPAFTSPAPGPDAVLWQNGRIVDLNNLIPAASGWPLYDAPGINSQGQIVASGLRPGSSCTLLLTPRPTADADLQLSVPSWQFAAHPIGQTSRPGRIWVYNSGPQAADFGKVLFTEGDAQDFAITENTCGSTLAPFKTCKVVFQFTPTAVGERSASLTLYDDAKNGPQAVSVRGFGLSK